MYGKKICANIPSDKNVLLAHFLLACYMQKFISLLSADRSIKGTVILNVGGSVHQVKWETIDKFPKSRLQKLRYATTQCELKIFLISIGKVQLLMSSSRIDGDHFNDF